MQDHLSPPKALSRARARARARALAEANTEGTLYERRVAWLTAIWAALVLLAAAVEFFHWM